MDENHLLYLCVSHPNLPILQSASGGSSARGPHRLGSVQTCQLQYALRYVNKVTPIETKSWTRVGTLFHQSLAYVYAERMDNPPDWFHVETLESSLLRQGEGHPAEVRDAIEFYHWFKVVSTGEPLNPVAVEQEFRATLADIDPDGTDEDEIHYVNEDTGKEFHAPRLNEEVITCRTDLVAEEAGQLYVIDHKSKAIDWKTGHLPKWNEEGEYSLNLQVLQNLLLVRHHFGVDRVAGFKIHRVSRNRPFARDTHEIHCSGLAYANAPRAIRDAVRLERKVGLELASGSKASPNYSVCFAKYGDSDYASACDYVPLCRADNREQMKSRLASEYRRL